MAANSLIATRGLQDGSLTITLLNTSQSSTSDTMVQRTSPRESVTAFSLVAGGWIISEEQFMQKLRPVLSKAKVRVSYGLAGNSSLDGRRFAYLSEISTTDAYEFGYNKEWSIRGKWEGAIGVPGLTWETVHKTDVGLELGFFNDALQVQFDYFKEQRRDIFMKRSNYPASAGFLKPHGQISEKWTTMVSRLPSH